MRAKSKTKEKGQTMMIVGLLLGAGVLIGLVAIAFDGGSALLQRRTMQNGAEAGSMAGLEILSANVLGSCSPTPCRPTYLVDSAIVIARVNEFTEANRGGTVGATSANYSTTVEYHYMQGAVSPAPCSDCYRSAPTSGFVPDFVDGLRVTARIDNPTVFAKAFFPRENPNGISALAVSARAAARLYPTCAPSAEPGETLPFTRFRPVFEAELVTKGNSRCSPFVFWEAQGDIGAVNSDFKNTLSFNTQTFYPVTTTQPVQLLSEFDNRNGPAPPEPPDAGLNRFENNANWFPNRCTVGCADMRGSGSFQTGDAAQDIGDWIVWLWRGRIMTDTVYPQEKMVYYPANSSTDGGRCCGALPPNNINGRGTGDWAEAYHGNTGANISEAMHRLAQFYGTVTPLSPPSTLNWGRAITRTIYLWGDPDNGSGPYRSDKSTQTFEACTGPQCTSANIWSDVELRRQGQNYVTSGNETIQRVRFTHSYHFVFYENMQGGSGNPCDPPSCAQNGDECTLPNFTSSQAVGFLATQQLGGPNGQCGWAPGGAVYSRQIEP